MFLENIFGGFTLYAKHFEQFLNHSSSHELNTIRPRNYSHENWYCVWLSTWSHVPTAFGVPIGFPTTTPQLAIQTTQLLTREWTERFSVGQKKYKNFGKYFKPLLLSLPNFEVFLTHCAIRVPPSDCCTGYYVTLYWLSNNRLSVGPRSVRWHASSHLLLSNLHLRTRILEGRVG